MIGGDSATVPGRAKTQVEMAEAFSELAFLLRDAGCDLIILEMMYDPQKIGLAFAAAAQTGLPIWAGFSARRGEKGDILSFDARQEIPFCEITNILDEYDIAVAGVMHSEASVTGDALNELKLSFTGPLMAYPDSGYFEMPHWQFHNIIPPEKFLNFATEWVTNGTQIIGGCCGLSIEHISALKPLTNG